MSLPSQLKTAEEIRDDILSEIAANTSISDENLGSVIRTLAFAIAQEIDGAYYATYKAEINGYILTAARSALEKHGADFGLALRNASKAAGTVTFTISAASLIVIGPGTLVSVPATTTRDKIQYQTTAGVALTGPGTIDAPIEALNTGSEGNQGTGTVTQLDTPISGVASLSNSNALTGGADDEDADTFRERLLRHIQGLSRCTPPSIEAGALDFEIQQVTLKNDLPSGQAYLEVAEDLNDVPLSIESSVTNKLGILNNTEVVHYTGIDTSVSPHRITGLTRGQEGTSDVDHSAGVVCKEFVPSGKSTRITSTSLAETPGHVDVYIDTGESTGADTQLVALVQKRLRGNATARDPGYRAAGVTLNVQAASIVAVNVTATLIVETGYDASAVESAVVTALSQFFSATLAGQPVLGYAVACTIMEVPGVKSIYTLFLGSNLFDGGNGADVSILSTQVARLGIATIGS